jgi:hypothetical protein
LIPLQNKEKMCDLFTEFGGLESMSTLFDNFSDPLINKPPFSLITHKLMGVSLETTLTDTQIEKMKSKFIHYSKILLNDEFTELVQL